MNKTDRLLAIVLELQRKGRQRAEDLAERFETSKRTIYRDILVSNSSREDQGSMASVRWGCTSSRLHARFEW